MSNLRVQQDEAYRDQPGNHKAFKEVVQDLCKDKTFAYLKPFLDEWKDLQNRDYGSPSLDLLDSDPVRFWTEQIKFVNRERDDMNRTLNKFKGYVKKTELFPEKDKTLMLADLNTLKKNNTVVRKAELNIIERQVRNSVILAELQELKNKQS